MPGHFAIERELIIVAYPVEILINNGFLGVYRKVHRKHEHQKKYNFRHYFECVIIEYELQKYKVYLVYQISRVLINIWWGFNQRHWEEDAVWAGFEPCY